MEPRNQQVLRIAIQKSGRLNRKSREILEKCGLQLELGSDKASPQLLCRVENFPVELLLVRDDDIPGFVTEGIADLGIVGENLVAESAYANPDQPQPQIMRQLGFGHCRLSIALPKAAEYNGVKSLAGKRIATSYPDSLKHFLNQHQVSAQVVEIAGSVEVTPIVGVADAICDLVATGGTLKSNGLVEREEILSSQAALIGCPERFSDTQKDLWQRLAVRIEGVLKARRARYIMMNAPRSQVDAIKDLIPGMETPTIIPLGTDSDKVALHAVAAENVFWETMEQLKKVGASSILVVPIEKIIE